MTILSSDSYGCHPASWSKDSSYIVLGEYPLLRRFETRNGQPDGSGIPISGGNWTALTPDGRTILAPAKSGQANELGRWNATTGEPDDPLLSVDYSISHVAINRNGNRMLIAGRNKESPISGRFFCSIWDAQTRRPIGPVHECKSVVATSFSSGGERLVMLENDYGSTGKRLRLRDGLSGEAIGRPHFFPGDIHSFWITPDGSEIVATIMVKRPKPHPFRMNDAGCYAAVEVRRIPIPQPVGGNVDHVALWTEVISGNEVGPDGQVRPLEPAALLERQRRLRALGSPPGADAPGAP